MPKVNKVTPGFVIQEFDTKTGQCVHQEFVASNEFQWEDPSNFDIAIKQPEGIQPFNLDMIQPEEK